MNRRDWYERVNAAWPAQVPALTAAEATKAVRRLLRFCKVARLPVKITSGNRHNWVHGGAFHINLDKGWRELVHSVGHWAYFRRGTDPTPHNKSHARLELRLVRQVVKRGWLDGRLKTKPKLTPNLSVEGVVEDKREHARAMLRKAETRAKRAETIRKKWARRVARLEKISAPASAA